MPMKNSHKVIVGVVVLLVLGLPLLGISLLRTSCAQRMNTLDKSTANIRAMFERTQPPLSSLTVNTNGDCTTGWGSDFSFDMEGNLETPNIIAQRTASSLSAVGLPTPADINQPEYIFGEDSNGGNATINQVRVVYYLPNHFDSYTFTYSLDKPIPCEVNADAYHVPCGGGDPKKAKSLELLANARITSVTVSGDIRTD